MRKFIIAIMLFLMMLSNNICLSSRYHFVSIEDLVEQEVARIIIPEIYAKLGIQISIDALPGNRAQYEASTGYKDGEIMRIWTYGLETPTTIRVPTAYYSIETTAFVKRDSNIIINNKADLSNYSLVKVRGVKHTNNITEGSKKVRDVDSTIQMMKFLDSGRADVALTNGIDGIIVLKKLGLTNIIPIEKPLAELKLYHYIHESHKHLVPKVDHIIKTMQSNGEMNELIKKAEKALGITEITK